MAVSNTFSSDEHAQVPFPDLEAICNENYSQMESSFSLVDGQQKINSVVFSGMFSFLFLCLGFFFFFFLTLQVSCFYVMASDFVF